MLWTESRGIPRKPSLPEEGGANYGVVFHYGVSVCPTPLRFSGNGSNPVLICLAGSRSGRRRRHERQYGKRNMHFQHAA
jgi:hypothetical protein